MLRNLVYYQIKPFIPREIQLVMRRMIVLQKRRSCEHRWPIDEETAQPPEDWSGWPEGKTFALILMHDVDTQVGQEKCPRLMRIDQAMGFKASFNFVPERYPVSADLRKELVENGFEVGVHGLNHDGKLFTSRKAFERKAVRINHYLKEWQSSGFVSPSMHRNLAWMHALNIDYDASSFDTDPFEPEPYGVGTIFPFFVRDHIMRRGYVELPYTLPQDFTLFVLMREKSIDIWKRKLNWIAEKGGMALLITHPDYMDPGKGVCGDEEYPIEYYEEFLDYVRTKYRGQYWQALPRDIAQFWKEKMLRPKD